MYDNCLLITIHGVWSDNSGLHRLGQYCKERLTGLHTYHINYGEEAPIYVLDSRIREHIYKTVKLEFSSILIKLKKNETYKHGFSTKIFVFAHSFGTLALRAYLREPEPDLVIDKIILTGSILSQRTRWDYFIDKSKILREPPINIVRPFDSVVRRAKRFLSHDVASGTRGFSANGNHIPSNHFKVGGHTAYDSDDFDEVVSIISGSFNNNSVTSEEKFLCSLNRRKKWRLNLSRCFGVC